MLYTVVSSELLSSLVNFVAFYSAGKIQISGDTKMLIDLAGGFVTEERGIVEIKVMVGILATYVMR